MGVKDRGVREALDLPLVAQVTVGLDMRTEYGTAREQRVGMEGVAIARKLWSDVGAELQGKTQVTVEYEDHRPVCMDTFGTGQLPDRAISRPGRRLFPFSQPGLPRTSQPLTPF